MKTYRLQTKPMPPFGLSFLQVNSKTMQAINSQQLSSFCTGLDWNRFGEGVVKSVGQVYGINNIYGSMAIGIGVFLASPLNFLTRSELLRAVKLTIACKTKLALNLPVI